MKTLFGFLVWATLLSAACRFLPSCHEKVERKVSHQFIHRSTQVLSDDETVEIYYDLENENLCYFYYFSDQTEAAAMGCVAKEQNHL